MTPSNISLDDPSLLVHAYLDDELDPAHALEVERQIAADPALAAERARVEALRALIAERLPREPAPASLVRRVEAAVGVRRAPFRLAGRPTWQALAASVLLALTLGSGSTWLALMPGASITAADVLVSNHQRGLLATQPIDVASSDRHTVKPWFNGKLAESPRVVDLAGDGFTLVGGRIDVIDQVPVPTLVYRARQHLISVTALPGKFARSVTGGKTIAGYNTVAWNDDQLVYCAVSDVAPSELDAFAKAFRAGTPE